MGYTSIEWTSTILPDGKVQKGMTWNPVTGCSKISPGCAHCYAERIAKRLAGRCGYDRENPFKVTLHNDKLSDPMKWTKPRKVFVCSMGDLFHEDVPFFVIKAIFARICSPWLSRHTFIVLTKRPQRMQEFFVWLQDEPQRGNFGIEWPLKNVWLGVTAENQEMANLRLPVLLQIPAAVRFVSIEPMIGDIDLTLIPVGYPGEGDYLDALMGKECLGDAAFSVPKLDWIIVGGETGPGAREMNKLWLFEIASQAQANNTPLFVKQISGRNSNVRHYDMPDFARVRMFPGDHWL